MEIKMKLAKQLNKKKSFIIIKNYAFVLKSKIIDF